MSDPSLAARVDPPTSCGAIVMAIGIFAAASLPSLPLAASAAGPAAAVLVIGAWMILALALSVSIAKPGGLARRVEPVIDSFGIGTWVAGTAVLARVLMLAMPDDLRPARMAFLVGFGLWLWFMPRAMRNLVRLARSRLRPSGIILLSTVATQAVTLMALRLFPAVAAVRAAAIVLMALGAGCYLVAAFLIVRGYAGRGWHLAADWANGNCILHGALSITGLTAVVGGLFEARAILVYWAAVLVVFAIVEVIEIARLIARVRAIGWREAVFVYDVSQWARNFTFGMLYAFTAAFAQRYPRMADWGLDGLREFLVVAGPYAVLILLLAETMLMLGAPPARR